MPVELSFNERRVLGVLLEKGFTTPEQYPLSLNSVVLGSNQKSCRDPMAYLDEEKTLDSLESLQVVPAVEVCAPILSELGEDLAYVAGLSIPSLMKSPIMECLVELRDFRGLISGVLGRFMCAVSLGCSAAAVDCCGRDERRAVLAIPPLMCVRCRAAAQEI